MLLLSERLQSSRRHLLQMVALVEATPQRSVRPGLAPQVMHLLAGGRPNSRLVDRAIPCPAQTHRVQAWTLRGVSGQCIILQILFDVR